MSFEDALAKADAMGEDLVEISPSASPPVCRIMDYGKFQYEHSKRLRDAKKKQHHHKIKEIKFHPNIDRHDYQTKVNHAIAFLGKGDKVKISMFFRGREMAHTELGKQLMQRVIADTEAVAAVEIGAQQAGRMMSMMLAPKVRQ